MVCAMPRSDLALEGGEGDNEDDVEEDDEEDEEEEEEEEDDEEEEDEEEDDEDGTTSSSSSSDNSRGVSMDETQVMRRKRSVMCEKPSTSAMVMA